MYEHKQVRPRHSHLLPVLLMFLKLPKLFNFHILRLAAERDQKHRKKRKIQRRTSADVRKSGNIFTERQTL